jgi:LysR family transcriptional regulator, transcriptional activator of the cysJI operon
MIEALRVFVCVVETENFSRAAEQLYLTQPTVSQQIRNLENDIGVKLLDRTPKFVRITEAGQILYNKAKLILKFYEDAKAEINHLHNIVSGALHVGASFSIGESILPRMLANFALQYPLVKIKATIANTGEIIQGVRNFAFDVGLVSEHVHFSDLCIQKLMEDEMVVIIPPNHPLSKIPIVRPQDLQDNIWIFRENGSGTRAFADGIIHDFNLKVKQSYEFNSSQAVKEAVSAGLGIAIVSYWIVRKEDSYGDLLVRRLENQKLSRSFYMLYRKEQTATMAQTMFLKQLVQLSI